MKKYSRSDLALELNEEINDLLRRKAELINTAKKEGIELVLE